MDANPENIKYLFDHISWPLGLIGIWPKNQTTSSRVKSTIFLTCIGIQLSMNVSDLMAVMGNLEFVIWNVMESGFQSIVMFRILIIRCDRRMQTIIDTFEGDFLVKGFRGTEEIKIINEYLWIVQKFYDMGAPLGFVTGLLYYTMPLQTYIKARIMNDTAVLVTPYRVFPFLDISLTERAAIVYACQLPTSYLVLTYVTTFSILLGFVMNMCAHLAILAHKISALRDDDSNARIVFHQHTHQHIKIKAMMQLLNEVFQLVFLCELVVMSIVIGLLTYQFLLYIDNNDLLSALGFLFCISVMMTLVYVNCFMGECLNTESTTLMNAYYECEWYEMSPLYKNALIICMGSTQKPLRLTAGKFYSFSLQNFTKIVKTSMVYVSMLRTLI